jgi:hypothetical protein
MMLKRFYKKPEGWVKQVNERGECVNAPPLDYVSVAHTGVSAEQHFSAGLINAAMAEGWCSISGDQLILHVHPEALVYTIKRAPGRWCCHCGEKLPDDALGELARGHVARLHPATKSPDPNWPAGYGMTNAYECVLEQKQHEQFRLKHPAKPPVFPRKEQNNG